MFTPLAPGDIHPAFSAYSPGVAVPAGHRLIFVSGQLGIDISGAIPEGCEAQTRLAFANIAAILREGGMALADIVRVNAYVTGREHLAAYMSVRNTLFPHPFPASTLMIVAGFARPEFVVEIEAVAAATR
jgi:enamine deaminase RidA (YjgF/YER057c/UK114 family)